MANKQRIALIAIGAVAAISLGLVIAILNDPLLPFKFKVFQNQAQECLIVIGGPQVIFHLLA